MPLPKKTGIYIGDGLRAALEGRLTDDASLSAAVNDVAARYAEIVRQNRPTLSPAAWLAVCDALNGIWLRDSGSLRLAWAEIADADRLHGLGAKWGVDAKALAEAVRDLDYAGLIALVDTVERFWADDSGDPADQVLARIVPPFE
jgi:hypothetical protein